MNYSNLIAFFSHFSSGKNVEKMWKKCGDLGKTTELPSLDSICLTAVLKALSFIISFFAFSYEDMIVE